MPNSRLHTNFQLNIFIFEARVSLQTLLQSLKQNSDKCPWKQYRQPENGRKIPDSSALYFMLFRNQTFEKSVNKFRVFFSIFDWKGENWSGMVNFYLKNNNQEKR